MNREEIDIARVVEDHARLNLEAVSEKVDASRKRLFIASLLLLGIYITDAVPTTIEPLGIDFSELESRSFLTGLTLVVSYLLLRYISDVVSFVRLRKRYQTRLKLLNQVFYGAIRNSDYPRLDLGRFEKIMEISEPFHTLLDDVLKIYLPALVGFFAIVVGFRPEKFEIIKLVLGGS